MRPGGRMPLIVRRHGTARVDRADDPRLREAARAASNLRRRSRGFAEAGAAAARYIEDQAFPKRCTFAAGTGAGVDRDAAVARVRAALRARDEAKDAGRRACDRDDRLPGLGTRQLPVRPSKPRGGHRRRGSVRGGLCARAICMPSGTSMASPVA